MTQTQVRRDSTGTTHPLDNPAWSSLTGPHAHFAQGTAKALRYPPDVSPFVAVPPVVDQEVWTALERLAGPGQVVALSGAPGLLDLLPPDWEVAIRGVHPPGWTEISAVCTDSAFRGRGLASRLLRAVGHGIRQRGDRPLMHASASNTNAIRLYESLGFVLRKPTGFFGLRTPGGPAAG